MMKKHTLAMGVTAVFIFAVTAYMKNRAYVSDDLLTANVEALARGEETTQEYIPDYKTKTDHKSHNETKIEYNPDGTIKYEREVTCHVYTTYCKSSSGNKCYPSLNGVVKSCD